jgi:hypothetical protein
VILIGIPTAANFYPPLFAGLAQQLPLDFIFLWMGRFGIFLLGLLTGLLAQDDGPKDYDDIYGEGGRELSLSTGQNQTEIEGCIQTGELCWKGKAVIENGDISSINLNEKAICPNCQTIMSNGGVEILYSCPNPECEHHTVPGDQYERANNLFQTEIEKIVHSEGESYSLNNLLDETSSPRGIWEEYASLVDAPHVSTRCFH